MLNTKEISLRPTRRGDHVIVLLRNAGLEGDVQFREFERPAVVEFFRRRILCLAVRQKEILVGQHFENDVADVGIADIAEGILRAS